MHSKDHLKNLQTSVLWSFYFALSEKSDEICNPAVPC